MLPPQCSRADLDTVLCNTELTAASIAPRNHKLTKAANRRSCPFQLKTRLPRAKKTVVTLVKIVTKRIIMFSHMSGQFRMVRWEEEEDEEGLCALCHL